MRTQIKILVVSLFLLIVIFLFAAVQVRAAAAGEFAHASRPSCATLTPEQCAYLEEAILTWNEHFDGGVTATDWNYVGYLTDHKDWFLSQTIFVPYTNDDSRAYDLATIQHVRADISSQIDRLQIAGSAELKQTLSRLIHDYVGAYAAAEASPDDLLPTLYQKLGSSRNEEHAYVADPRSYQSVEEFIKQLDLVLSSDLESLEAIAERVDGSVKLVVEEVYPDIIANSPELLFDLIDDYVQYFTTDMLEQSLVVDDMSQLVVMRWQTAYSDFETLLVINDEEPYLHGQLISEVAIESRSGFCEDLKIYWIWGIPVTRGEIYLDLGWDEETGKCFRRTHTKMVAGTAEVTTDPDAEGLKEVRERTRCVVDYNWRWSTVGADLSAKLRGFGITINAIGTSGAGEEACTPDGRL